MVSSLDRTHSRREATKVIERSYKSRITRRQFLRAGVSAGLAVQFAPLARLANAVDSATGAYDAIIIGGGTAGSIVAAKLRAAWGRRKRILIIEAGGPTSARIGGTDFPPWLPPDRTDLTIFDVPGEYSQIANMPLGAPYQLTETSFTYQGIGLGGNSQFNGMLFQTNPPAVFDASWPAGWNWKQMRKYFDRVRGRVPVTNTPSTDGVAQNTGAAMIAHPLYAGAGWVEADTSEPFMPPGVYSTPYVAATEGERAGPISGYFEDYDSGGTPVENLEILQFTKAQRVDFDSTGRARSVEYIQRSSLDQSQSGVPGTAQLRLNGVLIMAAGALITPRLLLLSGVGPKGREHEIFPGQSSPPAFVIDNQQVGIGVFDHVMTMVTYAYDGPVPYQAYNYGDYSGKAADLASYLANGSGPYAQYQPVSILNYAAGGAIPEVEIFLNPNGAGTPGGEYYGPNTLSAFLMLLNPKARGLISIDQNGNVIAPDIYLPDTQDGLLDTTFMAQAVFNMIQLFKQDPGLTILFGPGGLSHPGLNPDSLADVTTYVTDPSPLDGVYFNRLVINHFGGTAALSEGLGGVNPKTLILRGTRNVAVVDASLIPTIVPAHPVGTIMAVADRAGDILSSRWK